MRKNWKKQSEYWENRAREFEMSCQKLVTENCNLQNELSAVRPKDLEVVQKLAYAMGQTIDTVSQAFQAYRGVK